MPSYYCIAQYVPDPLADERLNVGVIAFGDGVVRSRFLHSWRRIQAVGGRDLTFLHEFAAAVARWTPVEAGLPGIDQVRFMTERDVLAIAGHWKNSIQISEPRASLASADQTLVEVAARFLKEPVPSRRRVRDRRMAAHIGFLALRAAIEGVGTLQQKVSLTRSAKLRGALDEHRFDLSVQNGKPLLAAQGLSFEVPTSRDLEREVDAVAWAIDDVRSATQPPSLAVIALPPKSRSRVYDRALHIFDGLGATVVPEPDVPAWAMDATRRLLGPSS